VVKRLSGRPSHFARAARRHKLPSEASRRFERAVEHARSAGDVVAGGAVLRGAGALPDGYYLAPTVVTGLADDDWIFRDELFVPLVAVAPYDTLDEALALANATDLGLTAGFFSADPGEVDRFLDEIQAGVVYVNRAAGATAQPSAQTPDAARPTTLLDTSWYTSSYPLYKG